MRVAIIGASGFIGSKLAVKLLAEGKVGNKKITALTLVDLNKPEIPTGSSQIKTTSLSIDLTDPSSIEEVLKETPDIIFHLAAVVSGEAETNFELGYAVNVDGARSLLETIRAREDYKPRFVFSSSLAVYGSPMPAIIPDDYATTPRGSYGTQKAIVELLLEDYTRKGYVDAVSIRFPTIAIRPGKPNKAASSFVSGIIREPLNGVEAVLPVNLDFRHTVASPRKAVDYLIQAAVLDTKRPGDRTFNVPGVSLTVKEMIEALERVAGKEVTNLIKHKPDPFIIGIVDNWPKQFENRKAIELGFEPDKSYDEIIRTYMKDELGKLPAKKMRTSVEGGNIPTLI